MVLARHAALGGMRALDVAFLFHQRIRADWVHNRAEGQAKSVSLNPVDMENFKKLKIDSQENKIIFIIQVLSSWDMCPCRGKPFSCVAPLCRLF